MPDAVIAGGADVLDREGVVVALDLLQAERVGLLLVQIFDQPRQPGADAVEVVGDDLHGHRLAERERRTAVRNIAGSRARLDAKRVRANCLDRRRAPQILLQMSLVAANPKVVVHVQRSPAARLVAGCPAATRRCTLSGCVGTAQDFGVSACDAPVPSTLANRRGQLKIAMAMLGASGLGSGVGLLAPIPRAIECAAQRRGVPRQSDQDRHEPEAQSRLRDRRVTCLRRWSDPRSGRPDRQRAVRRLRAAMRFRADGSATPPEGSAGRERRADRRQSRRPVDDAP